jgi:L-iditol 2-dehydrogenase
MTIPFPLGELWRDGIRIVPSYAGPPTDMRTALDAIADGRIDVATLITHRLPLERAAEEVRMVAEARDSIKAILEPAGRTSKPRRG